MGAATRPCTGAVGQALVTEGLFQLALSIGLALFSTCLHPGDCIDGDAARPCVGAVIQGVVHMLCV